MEFVTGDDGLYIYPDAVGIVFVYLAGTTDVDYMQLTTKEGRTYRKTFTYDLAGNILTISQWKYQAP
jgi:hypothetical protein